MGVVGLDVCVRECVCLCSVCGLVQGSSACNPCIIAACWACCAPCIKPLLAPSTLLDAADQLA